jgi:3-oxoacyl-[acyl-carrier protein] reductase
MDLKITNHRFLIGGATSGFGQAVANSVLKEGANVIALARDENKLKTLQASFPAQVQIVAADITTESAIFKIMEAVGDKPLHGILVNAGGPPAKTVLETSLEDWDNAYRNVFRWKIHLLKQLVPGMMKNKYGRVLFIESASVKEPIENLVLSNSIRLAVIGYMKTFSQEIAASGVTMNALGPGSHDTAAIERLVKKKAEQTGLDESEARELYIKNTKVGFLGKAEDLASLATWLLSPQSRYITGQTISVAGGAIHGIMG